MKIEVRIDDADPFAIDTGYSDDLCLKDAVETIAERMRPGLWHYIQFRALADALRGSQ